MSDEITSTAPASALLSADYFSVFQLPRKLALDTSALERAFYKKSREVHPDRFAQASPERQQWSLEQTSLLNDAYRTLKDPIARTEYLLQLEGAVPREKAPQGGLSPAEAKKKNVPPELLAEVFELNMQLEEMRMKARLGEEDPQLRADLQQARTQFEEQFAAIHEQLTAEWSKWDAAVDGEDTAKQAKGTGTMAALLDKRRYVRNLLQDVREALGA